MVDLLKEYKNIRDDFERLAEQEANKKDLTLKYPGATTQVLANKNVFDVYVKTKVLDLCQDTDQ